MKRLLVGEAYCPTGYGIKFKTQNKNPADSKHERYIVTTHSIFYHTG
ncbi:MAG: hypothetical protein LBK06_08700 [Planctomycetaceae bacterium]|nr:hypothetical protein [Planctomycetaceae bacterium]